MKKETFNMIIRFLMGAAVSMLICAGMIASEKWISSKPLIQQASGLKGSETVMTVDGEPVSAGEYLYLINYTARSVVAQIGTTDLSLQISEDGYTIGDYVAQQAEVRATQQAVIRKWAKDMDITLTEADQATLQAQKDATDDLESLLKLNGITEAQYDDLMSISILYNQLYEAYCGENGAMRPSDSDLTAMAEEHKLMTTDMLFISTTGLDDAAKADARALMEDYARQIAAAEDKAAAFAALEAGENVTVNANATYDGCEETALSTALAALAVDEVSGVVEDESGCYVLLRRPVDLDAAAELAFGEEMSTRIAEAQVEHNDAVYDRIDVAAYYTKFATLQQKLYTQLTEAQG